MTGKAHSLAKAAVHNAACTHCSSLVVPFPLKPDTSGDFNLWGENWMLREESMLISVPLLAPLHSSLGFARGKEVKGFGDQESPPLCPCPRLSLCSVLGMWDWKWTLLEGEDRPQVVMGVIWGRQGAGVGSAVLGEEECGFHGGTGALRSVGWRKSIR